MQVCDVTGLSEFAQATIERLGLSPHPEGGWYRRTWQSDAVVDSEPGGHLGDITPERGPKQDEAEPDLPGAHSLGPRPLASLIYFLLPAGDASAWHVVDADEVWLWHGPGLVTLELGGTGDAPNETGSQSVVLGAGLAHDSTGAALGHCVIPAGTWQRTVPGAHDALVSCVVSPGFTYAGFALANG